MARLIVDGADLVVGLSWLEKLGAVHGNVRVAAIRGRPGCEPVMVTSPRRRPRSWLWSWP